MSFIFRVPERIVHGAGSIDSLGDEASRLGKKALLVTGRGAVERSGIADRMRRALARAGVEHEEFSGVEPEPEGTFVDGGRTVRSNAGCDLVVAAGGGSVLDVGKAIAALANEEAETAEFLRGQAIRVTGVPCIAVPTTSGTGAEVTPNSVICDRSVPVKKSIRGLGILPRVALLDPELTVSVPPKMTAYSGMDALTQAVESLVSIHATLLTRALSLHAVRLLKDSLVAAFEEGTNMQARTDAAYGSLMAGMALANARAGVVHGIAHPLGVRYDIPHGLVCGVLLPHAMGLNAAYAASDFEELESIFGGNPVELVTKLLKRLNMPTSLKEFGLKETDFDLVARESMPSGSLKANPKKIEPADVVEILRKVA